MRVDCAGNCHARRRKQCRRPFRSKLRSLYQKISMAAASPTKDGAPKLGRLTRLIVYREDIAVELPGVSHTYSRFCFPF
ncbi:hypothetical protein SPHINGO391_500209 [Sphingomonas aurantiaca]|uniref:Uncharacterized protein n=1 Tax=Sphingomonas aurantiaca TaxID=185949 RepID=A0A5E8AFZ9_9SPHN|nr:hypothetical protein SPHINGO391_500209 [Sphingomonas aurantiaca]